MNNAAAMQSGGGERALPNDDPAELFRKSPARPVDTERSDVWSDKVKHETQVTAIWTFD